MTIVSFLMGSCLGGVIVLVGLGLVSSRSKSKPNPPAFPSMQPYDAFLDRLQQRAEDTLQKFYQPPDSSGQKGP